jgi:quaternary ammonium compound-resistance protein SugE
MVLDGDRFKPNMTTKTLLQLLLVKTLSIGFYSMAWLYLVLAGVFEIAWPLWLKISQNPSRTAHGILLAVVGMGFSGLLLWLAQRQIPMGTAYAVWTGIGAAGTFAVGILFFGEALTIMRAFSMLLIVAGVVGLKLSHV